MYWIEPDSSLVDWTDSWRKVEFYSADGVLYSGNLAIEEQYTDEDEIPFPSFDVDGAEYSFFGCVCWRFIDEGV